MEDVVIVSGVRTAIGRFQGGFASTAASDLAAAVIKEAVARAGIEPDQVDQVVLGCVGQVMEDAYIARHASVKAGLSTVTVLNAQLLARIFTELAAEMDPKNDDAVYASELQRLDQGGVDWSALTDVKKGAKEPEDEGRP